MHLLPGGLFNLSAPAIPATAANSRSGLSARVSPSAQTAPLRLGIELRDNRLQKTQGVG